MLIDRKVVIRGVRVVIAPRHDLNERGIGAHGAAAWVLRNRPSRSGTSLRGLLSATARVFGCRAVAAGSALGSSCGCGRYSITGASQRSGGRRCCRSSRAERIFAPLGLPPPPVCRWCRIRILRTQGVEAPEASGAATAANATRTLSSRRLGGEFM
jgi:hypothetical protein